MSAPAKSQDLLPIFSMKESEQINVLRSSLYPGAADASIIMVVSYCKTSNLDPMQKPVHIVPMRVKKVGTRNDYEWRDVIMPGIGLYRTQAARTGQYAGVSEPEFGPDVTTKLGNVEITYPQWCKVVVKRVLADGTIAEFAAIERWTENYATAGSDTAAPNAMWKKRPYGQLAKCTEAQALRKAFPEIGSAPTAEEMEGKTFDERDITPRADGAHETDPPEPEGLPNYPDSKLDDNAETWRSKFEQGTSSPGHIISMISSKFTLSEAQRERIHALAPIEAETAE